MKRIIILACLLLAGCSSFKVGGLVYCPFGASCSFQMLAPPVAAPVAAPAASGVSA